MISQDMQRQMFVLNEKIQSGLVRALAFRQCDPGSDFEFVMSAFWARGLRIFNPIVRFPSIHENRHLQTPMSTRNGDIASFLNIVNLISPTSTRTRRPRRYSSWKHRFIHCTWKIWVEAGAHCVRPLSKTLTLIMTKICDFSYPIYNLTKTLIACLWPKYAVAVTAQICR